MWIYATLLFFSGSIPFLLSFDKKLHFNKQWKYVLPSIFIVALFYILFDIYLTKIGIWGFNPRYFSNILIFNLPIEEWLFFIIIPYASIFLHQSLALYFPRFQLSQSTSNIISIALMASITIVVLLNFDKTYTVYIFSILILALLLSLFDKTGVINRFYLTFLVILIPFIAVNAILTGSFIDGEVVWYNNYENLGIRFFTIPIEDFGYAFSLILLNLLLISKIKNCTINNLHLDYKI